MTADLLTGSNRILTASIVEAVFLRTESASRLVRRPQKPTFARLLEHPLDEPIKRSLAAYVRMHQEFAARS